MKLYHGFFNINNVEIIYFKKFPINEEVSFIEFSDFKDIVFNSIKNEKYYIYKMNNKYYNTDTINNTNKFILTELFICNVPNLYIINDKLTNIVNILNISQFKVDKTPIFENSINVSIHFSEETKLNIESLNILNTYHDISNELKYDIILKNNYVNFIGINDNFKIYDGNKDITNLVLQKIFVLLKNISILEKYYNLNSVKLVNNNSGMITSEISLNTIYNQNIENITLHSIFNLFSKIQTNDNKIQI